MLFFVLFVLFCYFQSLLYFIVWVLLIFDDSFYQIVTVAYLNFIEGSCSVHNNKQCSTYLNQIKTTPVHQTQPSHPQPIPPTLKTAQLPIAKNEELITMKNMINNSKQKNKMNYLEKIQQSISVQNSHPSSTLNIKDPRHQPILSSDSNYQQDQQDSSLSVVVMKTVHNNLESDIFRGIFIGGVEAGQVVIGEVERRIRSSQDNDGDNKENIQIGNIINVNENKFIKKTVKSKSKVPIFEQIKPLAKYTSIDDSDSNPSSSQSTPPNPFSPFFSNLNSIPSKKNQDLQQKTCNTSKPSYLKFGDSSSMNKLSCLQSQILNDNCKNERNFVNKYQNCKNLLLKEIQKNRQLSDKVVVFGRENEELRGIICQIVGKQIAKGDSISKKSKKKMNRVTTQKTQSNFAIQSDLPQQKTAFHHNLRKMNQTESKKYSQKVIKTELGPIKRQSHQKLTKKTIKQLASASRNKNVEQLFRKVDRFQLLLNEIMQNNQLSKSSLNLNKEKQKEKERGFACLKERSVKLHERGENEMERTLVKKKFSNKKKRIKTQM